MGLTVGPFFIIRTLPDTVMDIIVYVTYLPEQSLFVSDPCAFSLIASKMINAHAQAQTKRNKGISGCRMSQRSI